MRDSLGSRSRSTIDKGELKDLPKTVVNWDIYEHAHALAEFQIVQPAIEALDMTHQHISEFCDWDLDAKHVTTVFAQMPYGQDLDTMMSSRKIIDDVLTYNFEESCVEVVKCYFKEQLEADWVNLATYDAYTTWTLAACSDAVTRVYNAMLLDSSIKQTNKNNNYGDEMFINWTLDDSPFDLLVTIGDIWDILFAHNEKPSRMQYYDNDPYEFYETSWDNALAWDIVDVDPDVLEEYPTQDPNEQTNNERLPLTSWVTPAIPDWPTNTYTPPQTAPEWWTQWGHEWGIAPSWWSIQNELCEEEPPEEQEVENELENAEAEREYVYDRNNKLPVDDLLAVALWAKVSPEIEAALWDEDSEVSQEDLEIAQQQADEIVNEMADIGWNTLDEFKNHVQSCVEQFTDQTKDKRQKILWKSITQPTAFTKCVLWWMCKEVGDETTKYWRSNGWIK